MIKAKTFTLKSPNGHEIVGTLETIPGVAHLSGAKIKNGKIEFEYEGDTEVEWNEQKTVLDKNGQRVFVDEEGYQWSEDEVIKANKKK